MIQKKNFHGKIRKKIKEEEEENEIENEEKKKEDKDYKDKDDNNNNEEEDEDITNKINEKKNNQLMRRKQRGLDVQIIQIEKISNETQKSIKSLMGDQFSTQNSSFHPSMLTHEKILEKYINEKIGINNSITSSSSTTTTLLEKPKTIQEEEKLYYVPKELKELEGSKNNSNGDDLGPGISCSIGIAEVALPIDYKLQNIEATEAARRRMEEEKQLKRLTQNFTQPHRKYNNNNYNNNKNNNNNNVNNGRRFNMSTDDLAVDRFKKKQRR